MPVRTPAVRCAPARRAPRGAWFAPFVAALVCGFGAALAPACGGGGVPPENLHCQNQDDCADGQTCTSGTCVTAAAGVTSQLGGPCAATRDCATDAGTTLACELDATGLGDGLCTSTCASAACGAGAVCADLRATPVNEKICLAACTSDTQCRSGWNCCPTLGGCLPTALCPQTTAVSSADLGAACTANSCGPGEQCRVGAGFPAGACTKTCVPGAANTCPANGRCAESAQGPLCLKACSVAGDCAAGYGCSAPAAGGDKVCQATAAADRVCGAQGPVLRAGGTAGPSVAPASCIKPQARSSLPKSQVQDLGRHTVGDLVSFTVPQNAGSISITLQAASAKNRIAYTQSSTGYLANTAVPTSVTSPDGRVLYDDLVAPPADLSTAPVFFATNAPGTSVMTIPNTTAGLALASGGLPGGAWRFTVNDYALECLSDSRCDGGSATSRYDVSVMVKPAVPQATATVDVGFYLVGAAGLTASSAVNDARVKRMVATLGAYFAQAGLCLGTVTFYDVPSWAKAKYATGINADDDSPCSSLAQMFTLARSGNSLNFFLVNSLTSSSAGGQVVGLDGTIPGPSTLGGTIHSGAAVNGSDLAVGACSGAVNLSLCGADRVAYIAAHEGGHWLGLYHTTEAGGDSFDPLSDSPQCDCSACVSAARKSGCGTSGANQTLVRAPDCASGTCGGSDQLMFWLLDDSYAKGRFSAQQGQVARANLAAQ